MARIDAGTEGTGGLGAAGFLGLAAPFLAAPFLAAPFLVVLFLVDLEFAMANLPEVWDGEDIGRATWGAATAMLGKVYLYDQNWAQAASMFKEVIDSGNYALTADIMDNFTDENEFNIESIFEVAYSAELNPGANGNIVDDSPTESGAEATAIATELGQ